MNFVVTATQIGILGVTMLLGFLSVKTGYIEGEAKNAVSKLIVKLVLPCLIISSITEKEITAEQFGDIFTVFLLSVFCIAGLFVFGIISAKLLRLSGGTKTVHKLLSTLGNVIFLGYPIINAVYGETGFLYAIIYWLINDLFLWTAGVFLFSRDKHEKDSFFKKLLNPNTISFAVAVIMLVFGIKLPPVVAPAVSAIGGLTTHLSMIFIGMALAGVDVKGIFKKTGLFVLVPLKLIVIPFFLILLFKQLGINEVVLGVVVLEAAMPAQTVLSILANEYDSDFEYSALGMFSTTVASLFTLPLVCYFLEILV